MLADASTAARDRCEHRGPCCGIRHRHHEPATGGAFDLDRGTPAHDDAAATERVHAPPPAAELPHRVDVDDPHLTDLCGCDPGARPAEQTHDGDSALVDPDAPHGHGRADEQHHHEHGDRHPETVPAAEARDDGRHGHPDERKG